MNLNNIIRRRLRENKAKRVGRGIGSGKGGHTVGKGIKGQKSRGKDNIPAGFGGGQVPLFKRIPKISGFKNHRSRDILAVTSAVFNDIKEGEKVSPKYLFDKKIIIRMPKHGVKILKGNNFSNKLEFKNFLFSKAAREEIEKSGSKIL